MKPSDIAKYRLKSQQLIRSKCTSPQEIVSHFGAMQAQDYAMAKWAIGSRLSTTEREVQEAMDKGDIIRTHVLRPTWHLVAAEDLCWMLNLTAPRIKASLRSRWKALELTEEIISQCNYCIEKAMANGEHLTRDALKESFMQAKIVTDDNRLSHILMGAEVDKIICSGTAKGKKLTYALMSERVKKSKNLSKEEALAKLAQRYYTSHGPATVYDFSWWSGLTLTDARQALELIKPDFQCTEIAGQTYWFETLRSSDEVNPESVFFLPAFDEFLISYTDRTATLESPFMKQIITKNGIFKPAIIVEGKVVGMWKRTFKKDKVLIETSYFYPSHTSQIQAMKEAAERFGDFVGLKAILK